MAHIPTSMRYNVEVGGWGGVQGSTWGACKEVHGLREPQEVAREYLIKSVIRRSRANLRKQMESNACFARAMDVGGSSHVRRRSPF